MRVEDDGDAAGVRLQPGDDFHQQNFFGFRSSGVGSSFIDGGEKYMHISTRCLPMRIIWLFVEFTFFKTKEGIPCWRLTICVRT